MLFQVNDAGLQRQMDIVQEELREIRLLQELFTDRLAMCVPNGSAWLQRQEKQIKKCIAFPEGLRAAATSLHAEVGKNMDVVTEQIQSINSEK